MRFVKKICKKLECLDAKMHRGKVGYWKIDFYSSLRAIAKQSSENCHPELNSGSINANLEPSPEFLSSSQLTKKFNPLTKREGSSFNATGYSLFSTHHSLILNDMDFSRFTSHFSLKSAAFTLAEVLITLGIIGVVAAMTMPTLINNINNKANINKLKREYSLLQQAFQQIAADNDLEFKNAIADCPNANGTKRNACLKDIFKSKLKTVADCDSNDGDNLGKCFVKRSNVKSLTGYSVPFSMDPFRDSDSGMILDDGASIAMQLDYADCTSSLSDEKRRCGRLVVDVNGPKQNPNTLGKDIFFFELYKDKIVAPICVGYGCDSLETQSMYKASEYLLK